MTLSSDGGALQIVYMGCCVRAKGLLFSVGVIRKPSFEAKRELQEKSRHRKIKRKNNLGTGMHFYFGT